MSEVQPMKKILAIESLRGFMAWWVVLAHAVHLSGTGNLIPGSLRKIVSSPDIAVAVFIIVSGFVITHLQLGKHEPYRPYITRRALRLAPLYLTMIAAAILLRPLYLAAYSNPFAQGSEMRVARMALENGNVWEHLSLHILGLHGIIPDTMLPFSSTAFLSPAWSISLEWQFYLVAPLVVSGLISVGRATLVPLALVAATIFLVTTGLDENWKYPSFLPLAFPYFLVGIGTRMLFDKPLAIPAIAVTTVSLVPLMMGGPGRQVILALAIWALFACVIAVEVGRIGGRNRWAAQAARILSNPFSQAIGQVSYSTYLCHIPIFSVFLGGALYAGMAPTPMNIGMTLAVALVAVLPVSFALYKYVEQSGNALGRKLARPHEPSPN